jgi:hypothetical protein
MPLYPPGDAADTDDPAGYRRDRWAALEARARKTRNNAAASSTTGQIS